FAPAQIRRGRQVGVRVGRGPRQQSDAACAGVGQVVEDAEYGGFVVVVDPGGDRERAGGAAVGDDGQALPDQFADHRILVGGVDDDRAVQRDVRPHVMAGGRGQDDQGVTAGERGRGGGTRHL